MAEVIRMCPETKKWETWNRADGAPGLSFCEACKSHDETFHVEASPKHLLPDLRALERKVKRLPDNGIHSVIADDVMLHGMMSLVRRALHPPMGEAIDWGE
jgi:hypothetical protein